MPQADAFAVFPERPPHVAEWEDLLVRLELTPRALRNALQGSFQGDARLVEPLREMVNEMINREALTALCLRAMATSQPIQLLLDARSDEATGENPTLGALWEHFDQLRARNFAAVQRRGLGVWEWNAEHPEWGWFTAYQLLSALAREDGRALAAIREAVRSVAGTC